MTPDWLSPFALPEVHQRAAAIIRSSSTNPEDIREVALRDLELSGVKLALDLGCGFGFMAEAVAGRIAPLGTLVGIDALEANREQFLSRVRATGRGAVFVHAELGSLLSWPDRSFDVVVSSYSLYFFVGVLAEVVRVLKTEGLFLAVTHSRDSFQELFRLADLPEQGAPLVSLLERFSAENGAAMLAPHFAEVEHLPFTNALQFPRAGFEDFLQYARFKLPLLTPAATGEERVEVLRRSAQDQLTKSKIIRIEKNDAVFRCRRPRCR